MNRYIILSALALSLTSTAALAGHPHRHQFTDRARVVQVQPLVEYVRVPHRQRQCWNETVTENRHQGHGTVAGAIVGGVIGHQLGNGHRDGGVATAVGTVLGAALGSRHNHDHQHQVDRQVRHCKHVTRYTDRREITGYDVSYRYRGRLYRTRMDNHPGRFIRVNVVVRLAE